MSLFSNGFRGSGTQLILSNVFLVLQKELLTNFTLNTNLYIMGFKL